MVGAVPVGGDAPVTVQTMTNTATADVKANLEPAGFPYDQPISTNDARLLAAPPAM